MALTPRAVVVHRHTELDELVARHGTRPAVDFFLRSRDRDPAEVVAADRAQREAMTAVSAAIPTDWRRVLVERGDLDRFVFGPEDVVVAVGQDGLVANAAKHLNGQVVVGIDPTPGRNPGVLVPHRVDDARRLLLAAVAPEPQVRPLTMVRATLDDGQEIDGLNEVFVGHPSHQSARYRLRTAVGDSERHSSSGLLIGTGTGATGWCRSVALERHSTMAQPTPSDPVLCWYAREAWPSPITGTDHTEGLVEPGQSLTVTAESDLVVFADGMEADRLTVGWGQSVTLSVSPRRLHLLVG